MSRRKLNTLSPREWMRFTKSWFICNPPPRSRDAVQHPAKFPEIMAREFIEFFTVPGETVLDPFAGVGSTLAAAKECGRRAIGIELSHRFAEVARRHASDDHILLEGDARDGVQLCRSAGVQRVQYIITSPPYWNMLANSRGNVRSVHKRRAEAGLPTTYSDHPADLANISSYTEFLSEVVSIIASFRVLLDPERYLTVVAQNLRLREGHVCTFAWDLASELSRYYTFKGERLWLQDSKPLGIWGYPTEFVTNVHHHYCLTFRNDLTGDARSVTNQG
ncbi:MAG: DNA methyltransferase [Armatimonadota bacterium]